MTARPREINLRKVLPLAMLVGFIFTLMLAVSGLISRISSGNNSPSQRIEIPGPVASLELNKEFLFPLLEKNKLVTEVRFLLQSVEKRNEIIVKGNRATAVKGRTFLILNIKITSNFTKPLQINTKDYFRLTVNDNELDLLAPDIHNDPVVVEPTSTEFTRLGWAINENDSGLALQVGEIGKDKTKIQLNLKNR